MTAILTVQYLNKLYQINTVILNNWFGLVTMMGVKKGQLFEQIWLAKLFKGRVKIDKIVIKPADSGIINVLI